MAESDIGGIGVKFTADATQLNQELTKLEQRLKTFNSAHGQTKIKLQAQLDMPGNRVLQDFRRDVQKAFTAEGSAGQIKARIDLLPPTAAQIKTLKGQIPGLEVDVIGNFKWGKNAPPKTVTVEVVEQGSAAGAKATAAGTQLPTVPVKKASAARRRAARVDAATWTQEDLRNFSLSALRDQLVGASQSDKALLTGEIRRRETTGQTNVGGYSAGGYKASHGPGGGGARGFSDPRQLGAAPGKEISARISPRAAANRYAQWLALATPEEIEEGKEWYDREMRDLMRRTRGTGWKPEQVRDITAAFSRNNLWEPNKKAVSKFADRWKAGARTAPEFGRQGDVPGVGLPSSIADAISIASGKSGTLAGHRKESQFGEALGGNPEAIAIDRWMAVMQGMAKPGEAFGPLQEGIRMVAAEHGLQPRQAQAIPWVVARNRLKNIKGKGSAADPAFATPRPGVDLPEGILDPITGGARGFASGDYNSRDDDPYNRNKRQEMRQLGRQGNEARRIADDDALRRKEDAAKRRTAARLAAMSPAEREAHFRSQSAELAVSLGQIDPGGQMRLGIGGAPGTRRLASFGADEYGGLMGTPESEARGFAASTTTRNPYGRAFSVAGGWAPPRARVGPGGPFEQMAATYPTPIVPTGGPISAAHVPGYATPSGSAFDQFRARQQFMRPTEIGGTANIPLAQEDAGKLRVRDTATGSNFAATPTQLRQAENFKTPGHEGVDLTDLEAPAFLRRQAAENLMAADSGAGGAFWQEPTGSPSDFQPAAGGGGGGGRGGRTAAGGATPSGGGEDIVGQPRMSPRLQSLLSVVEQGRTTIQEARQFGQVRAAGTTVASQLAGALGRGADVAKINQMTSVLNQMGKVLHEGEGAYEALTFAQSKFVEGSDELKFAQKNVDAVEERFAKLNTTFQSLQPSRTAQIATGLVSSIGGTIIGMTLFQGVTEGLNMLAQAMGPVIDRAADYAGTTARVTDALSDQARAQNGLVGLTINAQAAQIGMTEANTDYVQSLLSGRVAGEAANKNISDQIDLFMTAQKVRAENAGFGGVDKSVFQTTGGFAGTGLFGVPSTQELMGRMLGQSLGGIAAIGTGKAAGLFAGQDLGQSQPMFGGLRGRPLGITNPTAAFPAATSAAEAAEVIAEAVGPEKAKEAQEFRDSVNAVNDAMAKGGETAVEFAANTEKVTRGQRDLANAQSELADQAGLPDIARRLREGGGRLTVEGLRGTPAQQREQLIGGAVAYQRGATMPSKEVAARLSAQQIFAQLQLNQEQGRLQREAVIPGQTFLGQLAAGRVNPQTQRVSGVNLAQGTRGLPSGVLSQPGIDTSQLVAGNEALATSANSGRDALVEMISAADEINSKAGLSSNLLGSFNSLTAAAAETASTIRSISQASAWMQVNLQVKQINEQIFLMDRSLQDTMSFLSGAGKGELGLLQYRARGLDIAQAELGFRQQELQLSNQQLGVEASTLQLMQRQRQINFMRAVAGFAAPGATGEERAARMEEARIEADFAQKQQDISGDQLTNQRESVELAREQLGISKEQFAIQQEMITVSAERAVGDMDRAIRLLREQAHVVVQVQVNSEAIEAYQAVLEEQMAKVNEVINEALSTQSTIMSASAALIASYGGRITQWNNLLLQGLHNYIVGAEHELNKTVGAGQAGYVPPAGSPNPNTAPAGTPTATGYYGSVSGATQFTVGEAGPETVAIIRNPRTMMMNTGGGGGGGGAVNINVAVTGNTVGSQQDADMLASVIARKVEESMSRRSSLLGVRPI